MLTLGHELCSHLLLQLELHKRCQQSTSGEGTASANTHLLRVSLHGEGEGGRKKQSGGGSDPPPSRALEQQSEGKKCAQC